MDIIYSLAKLTNQLHSPTFPEAFTKFLEELVYFDHAVTLAYFNDRQPLMLHKIYSDEMTEDSLMEYVHRAYLLDPVYSAHQNKIEAGCYRLEELAPDRFRSTPYYESYYSETGISDEVIFINYSETGYTLVLSLFRLAERDEKLTKKEYDKLKAASPMILALMKQNWNNFTDPKIHLSGDQSDPLKTRIRKAIFEKEKVELTERQSEIIALTLRGHSATSIGLLLDISADTVKVHRRNIYSKLRISSQTELFSLVIASIGPLNEEMTSS